MKDILQKDYPEKISYDRLRIAVKAAWDAILGEELQELVRSMPKRCEAVIAVEGGHIPY